jgi:hypothetical protein
MEKKRHVSKLQTVFDLSGCGDSSLPGGSFGRVMFVYDEKKNLKEFTILNRRIPEEIQSSIKSWLNKNIDVCNPIWGSESIESDIVV